MAFGGKRRLRLEQRTEVFGVRFGAPSDLCAAIVTTTPRDAKRLGREVPGFSQAIWSVAARPIVTEGNYAKFTQNS